MSLLLKPIQMMSWCSSRQLVAGAMGARRYAAALSRSQQLEEAWPRLLAIVGKHNISNAKAIREQYSHDESYHSGKLPDIVVSPRCTLEVSEVAKVCSSLGLPIIPFGTGTGLESGVSAPEGGVCVNLMNMGQIREVNSQDFYCTVEPGVTRKALNKYLRDTGLFFPVDPGADASVCGMCATGASGTTTVRYGAIKQNVINLEVVLYDGTILNTSGMNNRTQFGDGTQLTQTMVGSEGTLGIITAATLRLHPTPNHVGGAMCSFNSVLDASNAVAEIMQKSIPVARIELLDGMMMKAINKYRKAEYTEAPYVFFEFHGLTQNSVAEQVAYTMDICKAHGSANHMQASSPDELSALLDARHNAWYAALSLRNDVHGYATDVCVPISHLPEMIEYATSEISRLNLTAPIAGHVGDGNFHCIVTVDLESPEEIDRVKELSASLSNRAIELSGSCTGEHGVGVGKRDFLFHELGPCNLEMMKAVKKAFDPNSLMNPGKVYPDDRAP